jgi:uncharacterized protein YacL
MFLTIIESTFTSILRGLVTNDEPQNYEQVAQDWLLALVVIAVVWALVAFAVKWLVKSRARLPRHKIWGRAKTIAYTLGIGVLLGVTVGIVWKSSLDFRFVVGVPGLFKGVFLGALLYTVLMLVFHLFGDARRDLYY